MQKQLIFAAIAAAIGFTACICPVPAVRNLYVSANTHALMDTYRDLVVQTGTKTANYTNLRQDTTGDYYCTHSAMPAKGFNEGQYGNGNTRKVFGVVTFVSYYWYQHNTLPHELTWFYTILAPRHGPGYAGFGDVSMIAPICAPDKIIYPYDTFNTARVIKVMFVPVATYQASPERGKPLAGNQILYKLYSAMALKPGDIKAINDVYLEEEGSYMHKNEPESYNSLQSSKGIVCEVVLKNGKTELCYVLNDYDAPGTLYWKSKK
jgi:hypothetical protein